MTDDTRRAEELYRRVTSHATFGSRTCNTCVALIAAALRAARDEGLEEAAKVAGEYYARYVMAMLSERYTDGEKAKASAAKTYACNDIAAAIRSLKSKGGE